MDVFRRKALIGGGSRCEMDLCILIYYSFPYEQSIVGRDIRFSLFRVMYFVYNIRVCIIVISVSPSLNGGI